MKRLGTPRDKLFQTAARLFYRRGYRAVGVDTIAEESGIGKMTLYRHYPTKDDLIVSFLRKSNEDFWGYFEDSIGRAITARAKLVSFFERLQEYVLSPSCYGCPFLNVATEYPEKDYPGHHVALAHKESVRARFQELAKQAGAKRPESLANALCLLMDGAYMAARMHGSSSSNPAVDLGEAARQLIEASCRAQVE